MELGRFWWWATLVLFPLCIHGCFGCWEEERIGLLQFKASSDYPYKWPLSSWSSTNQEELNSLDLSFNGIYGWVSNEGLERFSGLSKLEELSFDGISSTTASCHPLVRLHRSGNSIWKARQWNNSYPRLSGPLPSALKDNLALVTLDLSYNCLTGYLPDWIGNLLIIEHSPLENNHLQVEAVQEVEFTTKRRSDIYKGNILDYMSGIDLSSNQLTGKIPHELGNLSNIRALNLSYNSLTGSIPITFSKLYQIESLDLSNNDLDGVIPPQLIELSSLAIFNVAHNNFSEKTPERKA
ncbi:Phytosulfokine receptor 1 [Morella rubra]|uniref:Phytosulfokine receptor 1 n=1 Tax=Morella rubra TaxID=262757 RepID=A0A6A1V863_9ROSI|nr:Phytosulfokine receptor 1 [Morella rubra]